MYQSCDMGRSRWTASPEAIAPTAGMAHITAIQNAARRNRRKKGGDERLLVYKVMLTSMHDKECGAGSHWRGHHNVSAMYTKRTA